MIPMTNLLPILLLTPQGDASDASSNNTQASTLASPQTGNPDNGPTEEPALPGWFPFVLIGGLFYLILIRPQAKEQKRRQAVLDTLKKGDEVMTNAGIYGKVVKADGDVVTLQVADGVRMRFNRSAVSGVIGPKDEIKGDEDKDSAK
jgi:preprotein translocase subunit YajC